MSEEEDATLETEAATTGIDRAIARAKEHGWVLSNANAYREKEPPRLKRYQVELERGEGYARLRITGEGYSYEDAVEEALELNA
jgi:hypothetical protein